MEEHGPVITLVKKAEIAPRPSLSPEDLARCPGWPAETVQSYLDQGWTMDQLADYYQEQVDEHA